MEANDKSANCAIAAEIFREICEVARAKIPENFGRFRNAQTGRPRSGTRLLYLQIEQNWRGMCSREFPKYFRDFQNANTKFQNRGHNFANARSAVFIFARL